MNDASRLARLNSIKLTALVRDHLAGTDDGATLQPGEFPGGAALMRTERTQRRGAVGATGEVSLAPWLVPEAKGAL